MKGPLQDIFRRRKARNGAEDVDETVSRGSKDCSRVLMHLCLGSNRVCASRISAAERGLSLTSSFGSAGRTVKARHWLCPSALLGALRKPQ